MLRPPRLPSARALLLQAILLGLVLVGCSEDDATAGETDVMKAIDAFILEQPVDRSRPDWRLFLRQPPRFPFDPERTYTWKLVTNQGEMRIRMRPDLAPVHVGSTFYLTRLGFYDGLGFHRVLRGFMAQGGDPKGDGSGGPGYRYRGEFSPALRHDGPGVLSMANAGPATDGSQFFLTFKATPALDDRHTVFGKIEDPDSLAVLKRIEALGGTREPGRPSVPIVIERATILIE
jgi:cyclophilin family peptidyl-prolyl cis-trans isomerase